MDDKFGRDYRSTIGKMESEAKNYRKARSWRCSGTAGIGYENIARLVGLVGEWNPRSPHEWRKIFAGTIQYEGRNVARAYFARPPRPSAKLSEQGVLAIVRAVARGFLFMAPTRDMFDLCTALCEKFRFEFAPGHIFFAEVAKNTPMRESKIAVPLADLLRGSAVGACLADYARYGVLTPEILNGVLLYGHPYTAIFQHKWKEKFGHEPMPYAFSRDCFPFAAGNDKKGPRPNFQVKYGDENYLFRHCFSAINEVWQRRGVKCDIAWEVVNPGTAPFDVPQHFLNIKNWSRPDESNDMFLQRLLTRSGTPSFFSTLTNAKTVRPHTEFDFPPRGLRTFRRLGTRPPRFCS